MTPSAAIEEIIKQKTKILATETTNMFNELERKSPVGTPESTGIKGYVGGSFKDAWEQKKTIDGWQISNSMEYADILADGRRFVVNKWVGSEQWREGLSPTLLKYDIIIRSKFNQIKV